MTTFVLSYIAGVVHSFLVRKEYLLSLEVLGDLDKKLRARVKREYLQNESRKTARMNRFSDPMPAEAKEKIKLMNST